MEISQIILMIVSVILQIFSLFIGLYYMLIALFGFIPVKDKNKIKSEKTNTFAMIVSAHDEEEVIANLVESLKRLDYPQEAYDIFVIADNCTDNTAQAARDAGAIVYERTDKEKRGKGYALEWMFERLYKMEKQYDYISIFDADNLVDKNYLKEMNRQANRGYKVVQGYVDSKNPFDSWITSAYSLSFWSISRIFQLPRYRLGLCCQLSGTGFIISLDTLKKHGWGATCLTEDMEFTMKLAMNDERVAWAHDAIIYDEKPLKLKQSWRQRVRWMQGHWDVASRFWTKLVKKAFKERDLCAFDCSIYLLQPIRIIALGIITLFAYAETFHPGGTLGFIQPSSVIPGFVWQAVVVIQFLYLPFVIWYERGKFNWNVIRSYIMYIPYNFTWIPIAIQGMLNKNKTEWSHTKHTRNMSIDEFENKL